MSHDRDKMFGLATYLLAHGRFTYFGFERHPYASVNKLWFEAMRADLGEPVDAYYLLDETDAADDAGRVNLLPNGGFEQVDATGHSAGWTIANPVALDGDVKRSGAASM